MLDGRGNVLDVRDRFLQGQRLVVRRDQHEHVGTGLLGGLGEPDGLGGGGGAGLGDDRDAAVGLLDDRVDQEQALLGGQGTDLAGRSCSHDAVDAGLDGAVNDAPQGVDVDGAVLRRTGWTVR